MKEKRRFGRGLMFKLNFDPRIIGNEILPDGTFDGRSSEQVIRQHELDEFPQFSTCSREPCFCGRGRRRWTYR